MEFNFEKHTLDNGLKVILHEDPNTQLAVVNVLYNVGARDEEEERTGFAHLFEHLMFEGSRNAPNFDEPLQHAGGSSNAFTNNDFTNYYDVLPAYNMETALWLESDRMMALDISQEKLDIQKSVVSEEFKENYINQPYGDHWHLMSELAYRVHPYKWPTIGKDLAHIEKAELEHVMAFWKRFYRPNNAILVIGGGIKADETLEQVKRYFGDIEPGVEYRRSLPAEPMQDTRRQAEKQANVPLNAIYKMYHMSDRNSKDYYATDLLSDLLGSGESSRLRRKLLREKQLFNEIHAYVTGAVEAGLLVVEGKLNPGVSMEQAESAIDEMLEDIRHKAVDGRELEKVKNKTESYIAYSETNVLNRVIDMAFYELMGDASEYNRELEHFQAVQAADIQKVASEVLRPENCSSLHYYASQEK